MKTHVGAWDDAGTRCFYTPVGHRGVEIVGQEAVDGVIERHIILDRLDLTAAEARELAADLMNAADELEGVS
jgi:hypothetical protein